jgi:outer membrane lipoprotein SlyB
MRMKRNLWFALLLIVGCLFDRPSWADDHDEVVKDAAIGGAIGGALGGAVGAEVAGKEGAIVGAGVGAATGAAIATHDDHDGHRSDSPEVVVVPERRHGSFCPPGQAKKGRCGEREHDEDEQ